MVNAVTGTLILLVAFSGCTSPPKNFPRAEINPEVQGTMADPQSSEAATLDKVPVNMSVSSFEFEGYTVGKSHVGTFKDMEAYLNYNGSELAGFEGIIKAASVDTGIPGLDNHLKSADFFDVKLYPDIIFRTMRIITADDGSKTAKGVLRFHGVENGIIFPVEVDIDFVKADFVLDTSPYNMRFAGVNKEVRIGFRFSR